MVYASIDNCSPENEAIYLARQLFDLYLRPSDLKKISADISRGGYPFYIYSTIPTDDQMGKMLNKGVRSDEFHRLTLHQAGLVNSGLDETHKRFLTDAGLIDTQTTGLRPVPSQDSDLQKEERCRILKFDPPPL